jgi:hypothetical protein
MKSFFIYPTRKNMIIVFILAQIFPILVMATSPRPASLGLLLLCEILPIIAVLGWRLKPSTEFDEREKDISLKWKGRTLDWGSAMIIIPLIVLALYPEIEAWYIFIIGASPLAFITITCAVMEKLEMGSFFYEEN